METRIPLNTGNWLKDCNITYKATVKAYYVNELCKLYGITRKTFKKWLEPFNEKLGPRQGNLFSVLQVELIFSKLGIPYTIEERA